MGRLGFRFQVTFAVAKSRLQSLLNPVFPARLGYSSYHYCQNR